MGQGDVSRVANVDERLQDTNAEQAVIGSILLDPSAITQVVDALAPTDFHDEAMGWIYDAAASLHEAGSHIDPVTVADALSRRDGHLAEIGGIGRLTQLLFSTPSPARTC